MRGLLGRVFVSAVLLNGAAAAQSDHDTDGDGLSDFVEIHKHLTDPKKADSDGDGVPDGDWRERREYQYTIRTVVQVMRPVTIEHLTSDHQDARILDETADWVELEVIHYPFTTVADTIRPDPNWRATAAKMKKWTAPGATADWTPAMRDRLVAKLREAGIDTKTLDDKTLVERASRFLCEHAKVQDCFTTFVTAFDEAGKPFVPPELRAMVAADDTTLAREWTHDISARGMFEQGKRGTCSSSAIYLNGCLRALGIPTRIVLCIPVVDANDAGERRLLERGLTHHELRGKVVRAIDGLQNSWASHTFNEVFVGGRWRRLNFDRLGQGIADPQMFGLMTHVATFSDWADAKMPASIGKRQTLQRFDDLSGTRNPYSTIALRDEFGPHCKLENPVEAPLSARVTAAHWGDGADAPAEIREWFASRGKFGLVARVEGPTSFDELTRFLEGTDRRVLLVADGKQTLGVGLDAGAFWWKGDHALVVVPFGGADQRDFDAKADYRFVLRNDTKRFAWTGDPIAVPRR